MERQGQFALSFSGGKDSMLALDRVVRGGKRVDYLVTLYDAASERVRFHGVPIALIQAQAEMLGISLLSYATTPETFETTFLQSLVDLRKRGVSSIVFGNIHLADVRAWYEERTTAAEMTHIEPLWGDAPAILVRECIVRGYQATLTCIEQARARADWLGARLTEELVQDFEAAGIDACGEYGEYHTFVSAGPLFACPLSIKLGEVVTMAGYQLVDIILQKNK
ncbi:MAG: diphthine--ammonia ligase [Ktedonobacteraceae bacterium]